MSSLGVFLHKRKHDLLAIHLVAGYLPHQFESFVFDEIREPSDLFLPAFEAALDKVHTHKFKLDKLTLCQIGPFQKALEVF